MTTHDNGQPPTPEWTPQPHALDEFLAQFPPGVLDNVEVTWENPGDLGRMSVEAMCRRNRAHRPVLDTEDHIERGSN